MNFLKALGSYINAMWTNIVSRISGVLSVVFLVIGLMTTALKQYESAYWYWAFGISYAVASFSLWYKTRPRTRMHVQTAFLILGKLENPGHILTLRLYVVNHKPNEVNVLERFELAIWIKDQKILGELLPHHFRRDPIDLIVRGTSPTNNINKLFKHNEPDTIDVSFHFQDELVFLPKGWDFSMELRGQPYALTVVDVCGQKYTLKGKMPTDWSTSAVH